MKTNIYLKKKKQFSNRVVFTILLTMMFIIFASPIIAKEHLQTKSIYVTKGDTIWSIARNVTHKDKNINIQTIVFDIEQINDLINSNIYIGQSIKIPIY
jgi:hypothetical protein